MSGFCMTLVARAEMNITQPPSTKSHGYSSTRELPPRTFFWLCLPQMLAFVLFYKNHQKSRDAFSSMDFICSSFQLYKYHLHVLGFWPLPVETKSITHEPLNLQSFKIPGCIWRGRRTMETCPGALTRSVSFISLLICSLFILPSFLPFSFLHAMPPARLRASPIPFQ